MNHPEPTIRVAVDPTNPGQFFACCGLLELSDRLWPGAEGWFEDDEFAISCDGSLRAVLDHLVRAKIQAITTLENDLSVKPIIAPIAMTLSEVADRRFILDSWMRIGLDKNRLTALGNSPWNFWSGQQTSSGIWSALCIQLDRQLRQLPDDRLPMLFSQRVLLSGRFGFDPGAAWDALDAGFSPNAQNLTVASSPAVELLAAVGIQRFRPTMSKEDRQSFTYGLWSIPLAPAVAACAAAGVGIDSGSARFRGQVVSRGQYAALDIPLKLLEGDING